MYREGGRGSREGEREGGDQGREGGKGWREGGRQAGRQGGRYTLSSLYCMARGDTCVYGLILRFNSTLHGSKPRVDNVTSSQLPSHTYTAAVRATCRVKPTPKYVCNDDVIVVASNPGLPRQDFILQPMKCSR